MSLSTPDIMSASGDNGLPGVDNYSNGFLGIGNNANRIAQQERSQNMAYDTMMSNTAVQRRMNDLKAAGINPILAGMSAASTPTFSEQSGVDPSKSNAGFKMLGSIFGGLFNKITSALGLRMLNLKNIAQFGERYGR